MLLQDGVTGHQRILRTQTEADSRPQLDSSVTGETDNAHCLFVHLDHTPLRQFVERLNNPCRRIPRNVSAKAWGESVTLTVECLHILNIRAKAHRPI